MATSDLRGAIARALEPRALVAEDEYAAALTEARVALDALRLLDAVAGARARARDDAALRQLYEDLCAAVRAHDALVLERVVDAVREEMAVRGVADVEPAVGPRDLLLGASVSDGSWAGSLKMRSFWRGGRRKRTTMQRATICSVIVWTIALVLLAGSWTWFTITFVQKRLNPSVQVDLVPEERLRLPALTICPELDEKFPTWSTFPTDGFFGGPWVTVRLFQAGKTGQVLQFPDTKELAEDFVFAKNSVADCKRDTDMLDAKVHVSIPKRPKDSSGEFIPPGKLVTCQRCLTIGRTELYEMQSEDVGTFALDALRLELAVSKVPYFCFYPQSSNVVPRVLFALMEELYRRIDELVARGILDLNGEDPDEIVEVPGFVIRKIFFRLDSEDPNAAPSRSNVDTADSFLCGVYLFSGLWYPTSVANVSWTYNKTTNWWDRNNDPGYGPYFNTTASALRATFNVGIPPRKPREDPVIYNGIPSFNVYVTDEKDPLNANLSFSTRIAQVQSSTSAFVRLEKEISQDNRVQYKPSVVTPTRLEEIEVTMSASKEIFYRVQLDISFASFVVQKIITRSEYEVSAYLADMSNFFGIFTGTSIFSLLVAGLSVSIMHRNYESGEPPVVR